nr:cathepsin B-like [Leptinotarsa decemlineata]
MRIAFCFVVIAVSGALSYGIDSNPFSDEFIDYINSQQSSWKAGRNFDKDTPLSHIRSLLGALESPEPRSMSDVVVHSEDTPIPEFFDAREQWPKCEIINVIRDQSSCGSCWAVAATSAMSDRICIHSNGEKQIFVSEEDLISCCGILCGLGCQGGYPLQAWIYWQLQGLVSGGPYNSTTGCKAYSMSPCGYHTTGSYPPCPEGLYPTPACHKQCDAHSPLSYASDKSYGQSSYFVSSREQQIQLEILKNGPVEATFNVYEDFASYKSGVYHHVAGSHYGGHAVRLLGWGVENGSKYWLVANSWSGDWGDKGYFKILRGTNECHIENGIVAGLPKL